MSTKKPSPRVNEVMVVDFGVGDDNRLAHGHEFKNLCAEGFVSKGVLALGHDAELGRLDHRRHLAQWYLLVQHHAVSKVQFLNQGLKVGLRWPVAIDMEIDPGNKVFDL